MEVIIVDDGSTDETRAVASELVQEDPRVVYLYQRNSGACTARNRGWRYASGELIAFQDSDDEWLQGKIAEQLKLRSVIGESLIGCRHNVIFSDKSMAVRPATAVTDTNVRRFLLDDSHISTQTILVDKAILARTAGFDPFLARLQDWDLCLQVLALGDARVGFVSQTLVNVYRQDDSLSVNSDAYYSALARILKKHWRLLLKRPRNLSFMFLRLVKRRLVTASLGAKT